MISMPGSGNLPSPAIFVAQVQALDREVMGHRNAIGPRVKAEGHDRTEPSQAVRRCAVSFAVDPAVVILVCVAGRDRDEPRSDAVGRQAVSGTAVLRCPAGDLAPAERGSCRDPKARLAADALVRFMPIYQKPNISKPAKGPKTSPLCRAGCGLQGQIRSGAPTLATCPCAICTPGKPGHRHGPASDAGSAFTTTRDPTAPLADNRPPCSNSTASKPISRCRQQLKPLGNLPKSC